MANFSHLQPGQKLPTSASTWNAMLDSARDHQYRLPGQNGPGTGTGDTNVVLVKNDTDKNMPRHSVLGVDRPIIVPNQNPTEYKRIVALRGITPVPQDHTGRFVVLIEPLGPGRIGRAFATGTTPVKLWVTEEKHTHADVRFVSEDGMPPVTEPCRLASGFSGAAQIVWKGPRTVRVTGLENASGDYVEHEEGVFFREGNANLMIAVDENSWAITDAASSSTLATSSGDGEHGYPPLTGWSNGTVEQAARWATVRLGNGPSMQPITAKQRASALMQAWFAAHGVTPDEQMHQMVNRLLLHFHDDSHTGIAWNDVQSIMMRNEATGDDMPVPLVANEGYNQHAHSGPYDGGYIGLQVHQHTNSFNGGLAFACYHPGTSLPQQPWGI